MNFLSFVIVSLVSFFELDSYSTGSNFTLFFCRYVSHVSWFSFDQIFILLFEQRIYTLNVHNIFTLSMFLTLYLSLVAYRSNVHQRIPHKHTVRPCWLVCLLVGCLTSQQQASVSQGRTCSDNFTCCHTEIEAADQTFCLTQSQYTDTGPTSPSTNPRPPGAWQGSHWRAVF